MWSVHIYTQFCWSRVIVEERKIEIEASSSSSSSFPCTQIKRFRVKMVNTPVIAFSHANWCLLTFYISDRLAYCVRSFFFLHLLLLILFTSLPLLSSLSLLLYIFPCCSFILACALLHVICNFTKIVFFFVHFSIFFVTYRWKRQEKHRHTHKQEATAITKKKQ